MNVETKPTISRNDMVYVLESMADSRVGYGEVTRTFEKEFSKFIQVDDSIAVSSHQSALLLLLKYLELKEDDEIILSIYSHPFIMEMISFLKLKPIFVDIKEDSYLVDMDALKSRISDKTKVVLISHLFGYVVNIDSLLEIKNRSFKIIEDCSDALGVFRGTRSIGRRGDYAFFSFDINSTISTLKGGAIISNQKAEINKIREHLFQDKESVVVDRLDFMLTDIQSAMGLSQLSLFTKIQKRREQIGEFYIESTKKSKLQFLDFDEKYSFSYTFFPILTEIPLNIVEEFFKKKKISVQKPINRIYYKGWNLEEENFLNTIKVFSKVVVLPIYSLLKKEEVELIGKLIRSLE